MSLLERLRSATSGAIPDVALAVDGGPLGDVWQRAIDELVGMCLRPGPDDGPPVLHEGGVYRGTWIESTGTISAEVLSRFLPSVARETFALFARHARADGLIPYKVTPAGPAYRHIQIVTPLARSVWHHYGLTGDRTLLAQLYPVMAANDAWLARHRDTRGTGCVEAFCTFDTGHDASPRFWHVADTTHHDDPTRFNPDSPILPFLAPDLTANVVAQRRYLALIAGSLGQDPTPWRNAEAASERALFQHCFDATDGMFYDRDRNGEFVRVQTDVLLRVLACGIGDADLHAQALRRYLLSTRKFFARYPFTSLAIDDPRFSQDFSRNSWGGPSNFLSLIRAPEAFETHGHHVELTWALVPVLAAVSRMTRFPQTLNPWTGEQGYTEAYSPTILWLLDAVERLCGVLPRPDGEVWFTALLPQAVDHEDVASAVAYSRRIDGVTYEFVHNEDGAVLYRDGTVHARFPHGWRLVTDRRGTPLAVLGMSARTVAGTLALTGADLELSLKGNERYDLASGTRTGAELIYPTY